MMQIFLPIISTLLLLSLSTLLLAVDDPPFNFKPVVRGIALKIVKQCYAEYRIKMEEHPFLRNLDDPNHLTEEQNQVASAAWMNFRSMLWKPMVDHASRNCEIITDRCKIKVRKNTTQQMFCEFGIFFVFVKRLVDLLALGNTPLRANLREMMNTVENVYKIGWEDQKQQMQERREAMGRRKRKMAHLDFENITRKARIELNSSRFMHDLVPISRPWAYQLLCQLRERCKSGGLLRWNGRHANVADWYRAAESILSSVSLESLDAARQYNLGEIFITCGALFFESSEQSLCEYAKKLAYLDAYYQKFDFDIPQEPRCCGLYYSHYKGHRNLGQFLRALREIYSGQVGRLGATFAIDTRKNNFLRRMAYERMAEEVQAAIEAQRYDG